MRKIYLFLLITFIGFASCDKMQKQPLSYSVTNDANASGFFDVYIPDTGTYKLNTLVKFLSGYPEDSVQLVFSGLPTGITVTPDSFSAIPTYTENFVLRSKNVAHGTYPVTLTAYTPTQVVPRAYNFNVVVVPANAASLFFGPLHDSNACTARNYQITATGSSGGSRNVLVINNFGGYGTNVNVVVYMNEATDSLSIPSQICGNGSTVSGYGTYTESKLVIYYSATSTPTNPAENCTSIYTR